MKGTDAELNRNFEYVIAIIYGEEIQKGDATTNFVAKALAEIWIQQSIYELKERTQGQLQQTQKEFFTRTTNMDEWNKEHKRLSYIWQRILLSC